LKSIDLPLPCKTQGYSEQHLNFLKKVISLRAFHVPVAQIKEIFDTEKKILLLLHVDSLSPSPSWYLDYCTTPDIERNCLLLTGYKMDFALDSQAVQHTLDFNTKPPELFQGGEMGEDVRRVLAKYRELAKELQEKVAKELPLVEFALEWSAGLMDPLG
jgi:DNA-binding transcriptional MerR regulator